MARAKIQAAEDAPAAAPAAAVFVVQWDLHFRGTHYVAGDEIELTQTELDAFEGSQVVIRKD